MIDKATHDNKYVAMIQYIHRALFAPILPFNDNTVENSVWKSAALGRSRVYVECELENEDKIVKELKNLQIVDVRGKVMHHRGNRKSYYVEGMFPDVREIVHPSALTRLYLYSVCNNIHMCLELPTLDQTCYRALNTLYVNMRLATTNGENWTLIDLIPDEEWPHSTSFSRDAYEIITKVLKLIPHIGYQLVYVNTMFDTEENVLVWGWESETSPKPHIYKDLPSYPNGVWALDGSMAGPVKSAMLQDARS